MTRNLDDLLRALPPARQKNIAKRTAELLAEEMSLQELRKVRKHSQQALAQKLQVNQGEISKIEHRTDIYISTLRDFIEKLGGTLEITARFPNMPPVKINQFDVDAAG